MKKVFESLEWKSLHGKWDKQEIMADITMALIFITIITIAVIYGGK